MGGVCSTLARRGVYSFLVRRPEGKKPVGRPRLRWEDYSLYVYISSSNQLALFGYPD
jgi:hypothetical protein